VHCQQIIFGCSHGNGYARLLEDYMYDKVVRNKITLLEGVPFENELVTLVENRQFLRAKFGNLFRETKINSALNSVPAWFALNEIALNSANKSGAATPSRQLSRTPSDSVSSGTAPGALMNWAAKAAAAVPAANKPTDVAKEVSFTYSGNIPRNRKGQRVDPDIPNYSKPDVDRVKKMKMCNVHYLRKECTYGDKCTHRHDYKPSKQDLEWLKVVARMAACRHGAGCDDSKCIYGHRCQAPERGDKGKIVNDGGRTCIFGVECVFPPELHNMDCQAVKMIKV
jgi:hypothetical protein